MLGKNIKNNFYYIVLIFIFLLGVVLRLKGYLTNPSMWHDECALAWNIKMKTYSDFFCKLRFLQVAPPFFMVATKLLVNLLNVGNLVDKCDMVMRLIPLICGIFSIGVFYFLSKELLSTKKSIALALLLFAFNSVLIDYSYEFKPYSLDVFLTILLILFFLKINITKTSYKKLLFSSIGIAFTIWFSLVSSFVILAGGTNLLFKKEKFKKLSVLFFPILISFIIYFKYYIIGTYQNAGMGMVGFWNDKFILPDFSNFLYLFVENIRYFFFPVKYALFIFICILGGIFIYFKEKKYDFLRISSFIFIFLIIASILRVYPFSTRLIIFLIPIFILLIVKLIDKINWSKKVESVLILTLFLFLIVPQFQLALNKLTQNQNKGEFPREMTAYIVKNYHTNDKIFVNNASRAEYCYYSTFYNIKNEVIFDNLGNNPDKKYSTFLNTLPKGNYWMFLPHDYSPQNIMIKYIKNWAQTNTKILYANEASQSLLLYVKKIF